MRTTLKITSAMKMVASAKLHKAQQAIGNMLPYEKQLHRMLVDLISAAEAKGKGTSEYSLTTARPVRKMAIVAFASNSSLCGAFNSNAVRTALEVVNEYVAAGFSSSDITVYSVGRKMAEAMKKAGFGSPEDFTSMSANPSYEAASALAYELLNGFTEGRFDRVELVFNHFHSTSSQPSMRQTFLPMSIPQKEESMLDPPPTASTKSTPSRLASSMPL